MSAITADITNSISRHVSVCKQISGLAWGPAFSSAFGLPHWYNFSPLCATTDDHYSGYILSDYYHNIVAGDDNYNYCYSFLDYYDVCYVGDDNACERQRERIVSISCC